MGFLEHEGGSWSCQLVVREAEQGFRGHLVFRRSGDGAGAEVITTDVFVEDTEAELRERARALGRPLLAALLGSALHLARKRAARAAGLDPAGGPGLA